MLPSFSLSQLVLSSPWDVHCNALPFFDSVCRTNIVSYNFCAATVKLHLVEILLIESSHLDKFLSNCILLSMSVTSLYGLLGSNSARQRSLVCFDSFLNHPFFWLRLLSFKCNNDQNLINDKRPHERMLLVPQNESWLVTFESRFSE